jgi:microcystin degradation protein MlrC
MDTSDGPLGEIIRQAKVSERQPHIVSASVFCVQPWLDIPGLACATLVVCDGDPVIAQNAASDLARAFWQARDRFRVELHSPEQAIALAINDRVGPIVFSDSADSIGSGATGDATGILRALLAVRDLPGAALTTIVDPQAAAQVIAAGVDARVGLMVGGKRDTRFNTPVLLQGQVRTVFDGHFKLSGASYGGLEMNMGRTAVVQSGQVFVVITSLPTWTHHPDFYRAVGLLPERALIVVTKSNILFKASYRDLARKILWVDAPGLSSPNLTRLPFVRITRSLYPFDNMETFDDRATVHFYGQTL